MHAVHPTCSTIHIPPSALGKVFFGEEAVISADLGHRWYKKRKRKVFRKPRRKKLIFFFESAFRFRLLRTRAVDCTYFQGKWARILRDMGRSRPPRFGDFAPFRAKWAIFRTTSLTSATYESISRGKGGVEWVDDILMHGLWPCSSIGGVVGCPME